QIGSGFGPSISNFTTDLKSGVYSGLNPVGMTLDNSYTGWQHLFVLRHDNPDNNHQLQIASSFSTNDRLFFRKIAVFFVGVVQKTAAGCTINAVLVADNTTLLEHIKDEMASS
ncbi:MAG: hypothetical protein RSE47_07425, partial [Acidaminococcaceae bacterium]